MKIILLLYVNVPVFITCPRVGLKHLTITCYRRLVAFLKSQGLEAAKETAAMAGKMRCRDPDMQPESKRPSDLEVAEHNLTYTPFSKFLSPLHTCRKPSRPALTQRPGQGQQVSKHLI